MRGDFTSSRPRFCENAEYGLYILLVGNDDNERTERKESF